MVVFVVLHYNDFETTVSCIDYLIHLDNMGSSKIVVVDNCSPNGSGRLLMEKYKNDEAVVIILNDTNAGFACGNNIGYDFAKKNYNPEFIIVMNNDVMITEKSFITKLCGCNNNKKYEIIMPDIVNKVGKHQNPYRVKALETREINILIRKKKLLYLIYSMPIISNLWEKYHKHSDIAKTDIGEWNRGTMLVPHGACVIYSEKWIKQENFAFLPETFMYHEEDILYEYLLNKGYKTFFANEISVRHLEDVATRTISKNSIVKARFYLKNSIPSLLVLKKIRLYNMRGKDYIEAT